MPFGDVLKAALSTVNNVVKGDEITVTSLARDIALVTPPSDGLVPGMGRGADEVVQRIKESLGQYTTLLIDLVREGGELAVLHEGPVAWFAFEDTSAPPLQLLWSFVAAALEHSRLPDAQVCVVMDPPTEGRTALVVICYVLFTMLFVDERKAINWYRSKRGKHVAFTPSQLRYMSYFLQCIGQQAKFTPPPQIPVLVRMITLRNLPVSVASRHRVMLEVEHVRAVYSQGNPFSNRAKTSKICVFTPGENGIIKDKDAVPAKGVIDSIDILVNSYVEDDFNLVLWTVNDFRRKEVLFNLQLHTSFLFSNEIQNGIVVSFSVAQMDNVVGLGNNFTVELDMVSERRAEPVTVDQGSMIIVNHAAQTQRGGGGGGLRGGGMSVDMGQSTASAWQAPDSPGSVTASMIARIPSDDLMMSDIGLASGIMPRPRSSVASPRRAERLGFSASAATSPAKPRETSDAVSSPPTAAMLAAAVTQPEQPQWVDANVATTATRTASASSSPQQAQQGAPTPSETEETTAAPPRWRPGPAGRRRATADSSASGSSRDATNASPSTDTSGHDTSACANSVNAHAGDKGSPLEPQPQHPDAASGFATLTASAAAPAAEQGVADAMAALSTSLDPRHSPTNDISAAAGGEQPAAAAMTTMLPGAAMRCALGRHTFSSFGSIADGFPVGAAFGGRSVSGGGGCGDDGVATLHPPQQTLAAGGRCTPTACAAAAAGEGGSERDSSPSSPRPTASVNFRLSPSLTASHQAANNQSTLTTTIGGRQFSHGAGSSSIFHSCYSQID